MRRLFRSVTFWFLVVVVAATVLNLRALGQAEDHISTVAAKEAQTNYDNQLASCQAGNPVRKAVVLAVSTAAQVATKGNARYEEAREQIVAAPHVRKDGSRDCKEAVIHP